MLRPQTFMRDGRVGRRGFLALAGGMVLVPRLISRGSGSAVADSVDVGSILRDPDVPVSGNPDGDVVVAAFTDYNCPFCKAAVPNLDRLLAEDKGVRLVHKDWPILTNASLFGARLALGARYKGGYDRAHHALMEIPGSRIPQKLMLDSVRASGIDMEALEADLRQHADDINALLARNAAQADSLGLAGTPSYLIGNLLYNTLDYAGLRRAVADARRQAASKEST